MTWIRRMAPALLAGATAANAAGMYVCGERDRIEYRDDAQAANCRATSLAPVGVVTATRRVDPAPPMAAPSADDDAGHAGLRGQLAAERRRIDALAREYNDGQPERRGDERNYAKYRQRTADLKAALEEAEARAAALQRQLGR